MAEDVPDARPRRARSRKRSRFAGSWFVGRHIRGLWVKSCTALPPIASIRSIAVWIPPELETWPPIQHRASIARRVRRPVRVRMAPSPTGFLHIGGVRTFLFNWLFARGRGGELPAAHREHRHEPRGRRVGRADRALALAGSGSTGTARRPSSSTAWSAPRQEARRLVEEGAAYEDEGAIRIRMPDEGTTGWDDAVKGWIEFPNEQLEDLVLVRSDGRPTYNFASPLEDWLDGITHVIRGDDHVSNTPKQIHVLRALGAEPPVYAHVPNVFGTDGKKLSKRHGAVSVDEFRAAGYVAPALLNFLALLGWSYDDKTTIMSRDELVERFSLERVGIEPGDVRLREARLDERPVPPLHDRRRVRRRLLTDYLAEVGFPGDEGTIRRVAPLVQEKIATLGEFPQFAGLLLRAGRARPGAPRGRGVCPRAAPVSRSP